MSAMGIGLIIFIILFFVLGVGMYFLVQGSGKRYIIAGKSLPFFLVGSMLLAQSLDANATMGNAAGVYGAGWWAGFQFPLGLALCLLLTGAVYAKPLNRMNLITLPDFYYRRYNWLTEVLVGLLMCFSFAILVAGNFAGSAWIVANVFNMNYVTALIIISLFIFIYTVSGGLYSCAATDIVQIYPALIGFVGCFFYLLADYGWSHFSAAIPDNFVDFSGLYSIKNGALLNWAGILALAIGDVVALDFMERVFAAKTPETAQKSCYYGAAGTLIAGVVCSYIGLMGLTFFPEISDPRQILPTIAQAHVPFIFGLLVLGGIIGAGASTADGGILGVSSVLGRNILQRNILRPLARKRIAQENAGGEKTADEKEVARRMSDRRLLIVSRIMAVPVVVFAIYLAIVKPEPGILLVLAFDVVFAGCLVPLTLGIYWKKANTPGALAAVIVGSVVRLYLFYNIPEELAGLDTLVAPIASLLVMVPVSLMTQKSYPPKHEMITFIPDDMDVLSGKY
ncbi:MAG: sodium:solute symporter [Deltaproteobacteria bacterium]|jgi:Na+/proline symporter|nr:sodium:solute symporter [Deltaproteobacteria bacterium]MBW2482642.1 sodium:solute symporter [Deltaproteobacteria bacterium]